MAAAESDHSPNWGGCLFPGTAAFVESQHCILTHILRLSNLFSAFFSFLQIKKHCSQTFSRILFGSRRAFGILFIYQDGNEFVWFHRICNFNFPGTAIDAGDPAGISAPPLRSYRVLPDIAVKDACRNKSYPPSGFLHCEKCRSSAVVRAAGSWKYLHFVLIRKDTRGLTASCVFLVRVMVRGLLQPFSFSPCAEPVTVPRSVFRRDPTVHWACEWYSRASSHHTLWGICAGASCQCRRR